MSTPFVDVSQLSVGYGSRTVLQNINLHVCEGERWAVIGRNGAGKSTLVKALAGLLLPHSGIVRINGKDIKRYSARKRAQYIAYVPQKAEAVIPYTVHDFVMLGRYARMGLLGVPDKEDRKAVSESLAVCDIRGLRNRIMSTLSGGEMQRVLLAGALAQETKLLLLDEPTIFLDPAHEKLFLSALEKAQKNRAIATIMVTHDINSAFFSCTHILALNDGHTYYSGNVESFIDSCPDILRIIYGISFESFNGSYDNRIFGTWGVNTK